MNTATREHPNYHTWRSIPGLPGFRADRSGHICKWRGRTRLPKILTTAVSKKGYLTVYAAGKNYRVHRLVLLTFVGPCPEGMQSCHNNGIPSDNRRRNLRWDTPKNNTADIKRHGRFPVGSTRPNAKLSEADIPLLRQMLADGFTLLQTASRFHISIATVRKIRDGQRWTHVQREAA